MQTKNIIGHSFKFVFVFTFIFFFYGFARFPDSPIHLCGENRYAGNKDSLVHLKILKPSIDGKL